MARERPLKAAIIGGYPRDDDYAREVRGRISGLRGEGVKVEVTGFVENSRVSSYLNRSRVVLVTSPSEGFGRMAAEALACEVPVVASRVGGLTEIVEHGVNGFFARYNDVEDFARWALLLLNDEPLRRTMGGQGRRDVMRKFSVAEMVDKYESLYRGIMKKYCDRRLRQRRV
jgi:glycosyltransferase involved in cell wall biosynthesis